MRDKSHARLRAAYCGLLLACALQAVAAEGYSTKPIRVIVPSQAGGGADIVARAIGQKLTEDWGQQVVVNNRIGVVGVEIAARAIPDGYTIMLTTSALAVRETVYRKVAEARYFKGHARRPLTDAEVERKFRSLAAKLLTPRQIDAFLAKAWALEELSDIGERAGR